MVPNFCTDKRARSVHSHKSAVTHGAHGSRSVAIDITQLEALILIPFEHFEVACVSFYWALKTKAEALLRIQRPCSLKYQTESTNQFLFLPLHNSVAHFVKNAFGISSLKYYKIYLQWTSAYKYSNLIPVKFIPSDLSQRYILYHQNIEKIMNWPSAFPIALIHNINKLCTFDDAGKAGRKRLGLFVIF